MRKLRKRSEDAWEDLKKKALEASGELRSTIGDKWKELKAGFAEAMDQLNQAVQKTES